MAKKPASGQIVVRFPANQMEAVRRHAKERGMTVSRWVRSTICANLVTPSSPHMPPLQGFYKDVITYGDRKNG